MAKKPSDRKPTAEERDLFRAAMADAEPLVRRNRSVASEIEDSPLPAVGRKPRATTARPAAPPEPPAAPPMPQLEAGRAADLDRRTMDRLRKGRMRPEGRLDLHGMTAADAHRALGGFLADAQTSGKRCVLVITGKGSLKQGGGIIRRELPAWLNAPGNRTRVLGFAQAQPADGGGGAFYVLLKRKR